MWESAGPGRTRKGNNALHHNDQYAFGESSGVALHRTDVLGGHCAFNTQNESLIGLNVFYNS